MSGPLSGLKILDFSALLPGPFATMYLADMGADVLCVASPSRQDMTAMQPPVLDKATGMTAPRAYLGRGKRSIALNLKAPGAVEIIKKLIQEYDVVVEQFRPGVMAKLGLSYEELKKSNPRLIYCSITGYGQSGPLAMRPGHDINYIARSGVMSYAGRKADGPTIPPIKLGDNASGSMNAIIGILAAVFERSRSGEGQYIDISMLDGIIALNAVVGAAAAATGKNPKREKEMLNGGSIYDFYETKDGEYLSVGALEPKFFKVFCEKLSCEDLLAGGVMPKNIGEVKERLRNIFKGKTKDEWLSLFGDSEICVEPVMTMNEVLEDENTKARDMVIDVEYAEGKTVRQVGLPILFSRSKAEIKTAGVMPGTHTVEVLHEIGCTDDQIQDLEEAGLFK